MLCDGHSCFNRHKIIFWAKNLNEIFILENLPRREVRCIQWLLVKNLSIFWVFVPVLTVVIQSKVDTILSLKFCQHVKWALFRCPCSHLPPHRFLTSIVRIMLSNAPRPWPWSLCLHGKSILPRSLGRVWEAKHPPNPFSLVALASPGTRSLLGPCLLALTPRSGHRTQSHRVLHLHLSASQPFLSFKWVPWRQQALPQRAPSLTGGFHLLWRPCRWQQERLCGISQASQQPSPYPLSLLPWWWAHCTLDLALCYRLLPTPSPCPLQILCGF